MILTLTLPFPPSMNRLWRVGKENTMYRSDVYERWKKEATWTAKIQVRNKCIKGPFKLTITFVKPDKRHRDLDNLLKAVLDCLQSVGAIENDKNCVWIDARYIDAGDPCSIVLEAMDVEG